MRKSSSFPSGFTPDRGPARYFHGRAQELSAFRGLLRHSIQDKGGTTFLIQGAPGAGKTALLIECEKLAQKRGWETARIHSEALWSAAALRGCLGGKKLPSVTGGTLQISMTVLAKLGITVDRDRKTTLDILETGKTPLLLKLDEAQILGEENELPADQIKTVRRVLNAIHNSELNRPVILIAAGLGTTKAAFGALGISRFSGGAFVKLGALDKEAERTVLYDWLKKEGKAKGDPTAWIDAIAQETHGWPQHILAYTDPLAVTELQARGGEMTTEGLTAVLEAGRARRAAYYEQRGDEFRGDQIRCLAKAITCVPPGEPVEYRDIVSSLTVEYGDSEAQRLFQRFLEKGVLEKCGIGYAVPVPSMHDWLVSNYAHIHGKKGPSRLIGQSQAQSATAIVTQETSDQGIPAQSQKPPHDVKDQNPGLDFGR